MLHSFRKNPEALRDLLVTNHQRVLELIENCSQDDKRRLLIKTVVLLLNKAVSCMDDISKDILKSFYVLVEKEGDPEILKDLMWLQ